MKKLISMTDFVLEQNEIRKQCDLPKEMDKNNISFAKKVLNYAKFLKQPLTLGMFVPCDEDGNIMDVNSIYDPRSKTGMYYPWEIEQAKERVLFEGFEIIRGEEPSQFTLFSRYNNESIGFKKDREEYFDFDYTCIESLVYNNLTLTPYALKQIGI